MGRPMGRVVGTGKSGELGGSYAVAITLASVGPYVLIQRTRLPTTVLQAEKAFADAFSPPTITRRNPAGTGSFSSESSCTISCQYAVGKSNTLMFCCRTQRRKSATC